MAALILLYLDLVLSGGILKTALESDYTGFKTLAGPTIIIFLMICSIPGLPMIGTMIYEYADKSPSRILKTIIYSMPLWIIFVIGASLRLSWQFINDAITNIGNSISSIAELLALPFIVITVAIAIIYISLGSYKKKEVRSNENFHK